MNYGGDAAEQIMRMSLNGVEMVAKITGAGAKELATYLYAVLSQQKKTKGQARLATMVKTGKELKVFSIKNEDLKKFSGEAKRYGILFCAIKDKDGDGMSDVIVKAEDAPRINRIVERFKFAVVDTASIKSEIEKTKTEKVATKTETDTKDPVEITTPVKSKEDMLLDEIMSQPQAKEEAVNKNPTTAPLNKQPHQSERSSATSSRSADRNTDSPKKQSVRVQLREISAEIGRGSTEPEKAKTVPGKSQTHTSPGKKKKSKSRKERSR